MRKLSILVLGFICLTVFSIDPDFGWHLAYGRMFLESWQQVTADPFSWTMPGYEWGNYFFLYQILITFIFNNLGYLFLSLIFGLLASLAFFIIFPKNANFIQILISLLGLLIVRGASYGVRPATITFLMFSILLVLIEKGFYKNKSYALFWLLFFAIWANFHQGFVVGLAVLATHWALNLIKAPLKKRSGYYIDGLLCIIASFIGTLLTPSKLGLWKGIIFDLTGVKTWANIGEWRSSVYYFPLNLLLLISAVFFIYVIFKKFKEVDPVWFLIAAFVFAWAFITTHVALFWAALFIFLIPNEITFNLRGTFFSKFPAFFAFWAGLLTIFLRFAVDFYITLDLRQRIEFDKYPLSALSYMSENKLGENILNNYGWGGFIDWQYSGIKVFIDGRMTGWRKENRYILADYLAIDQGKCSVADKYEIKTVLVNKDNAVLCFKDFKKVYEDDVAKVLVR